MTDDIAGGMTFLVFAAAIAFQAWRNRRRYRTMRERWPRVAGVVRAAETRVVKLEDSDLHLLHLTVDTAGGPVRPRGIPFGSQADNEDGAAHYAIGTPVVLRPDPKGKAEDVWLDGFQPYEGWGWLWATAIALAALAALVALGLHRALFGIGA
jgi:hypothetical protein